MRDIEGQGSGFRGQGSGFMVRHGRLTVGEYRQFLGISRGSNFELQTQLEIARALSIGDAKSIGGTDALRLEVGKMIYAILNKSEDRG